MADPAKSPDPTDQELVKLVRQGDQDAWNELHRRYGQRVYERALKKLGDRDAADSIRQQTFITVYEKIDQFRGESSLSAWIMPRSAVASTTSSAWGSSRPSKGSIGTTSSPLSPLPGGRGGRASNCSRSPSGF